MISRRLSCAIGIVLAAISLAACQPTDPDPSADTGSRQATEVSSDVYVVEILARDYAFVGPAEISSGWTTFRLTNEGTEHHFLFLSLLPDGKMFDDYVAEVALPFDSVWHELRDGTIDKPEAGAMLGRLLPEWFGSVKPMGGPGLVAAGGVAQTSVELEPGVYVMECYVKTPDGEFHGMLGMARPLTVTSDASGALEPQADIEITLSNYDLRIRGDMTAGEHTVAVHFQEHPNYGLGNDVHLVRLEDGTDTEQVVRWMDWMNVDGLRAPGPAQFVGGTHEMPVGYTAYFTVNLAPGRYAWIAESTAEGMVREFTIE
ncbi:MAG: hypothetical protein V3U67_10375 [Gemmatimonadota bacterium]